MARSNWILPFILLSAGVSAHAFSPARTGGVGVVLGDPIGPTVKYWMRDTQAIQLGLGFQEDFVVYGDYLWESWDIFPQPSRGALGGYVGLGPRFEEVDHGDDRFGIRTVGGLNYFLDTAPIELFVELAPVFQTSPDTDVDLDAGFGLRFYFGLPQRFRR